MAFLFSKYRFFLSLPDSETPLQVYPINDKLTFSYEISNNKAKLKLNEKLVFDNSQGVFTSLYAHDNSFYRCFPVPISIENNCDGTWVERFVGEIRMVDCEFDVSRCFVTVEIVTDDLYYCFEQFEEKEYEMDTFIPVTHDVMLNPFSANGAEYVIETQECLIEIPGQNNEPPQIPPPNDCVINEVGYAYISTDNTYDEQNPNYTNGVWYVKAIYKREKYTGTTPPDGNDWLQISVDEWVRPAGNTADVISQYGIDSLKYGYKLNWVLQYLFGAQTFPTPTGVKSGGLVQVDICPMVVVSNFFDINADNTAPLNEVYNSVVLSKIKDIFVFQKSDILRLPIFIQYPTTAVNAQPKIKYKEFLEDLGTAFNVVWWIEPNSNNITDPNNPHLDGKPILRIEHVSYFEEKYMLDLRQSQFNERTAFNWQYKYNKQKLPQKEVWKWQEQTDYDNDFDGKPISYDINCSDKDSKEVVNQCRNIMTNLPYLLNKIPTISNKTETNEFIGFVLVATDYNATTNKYHVSSDLGLISGIQKKNNYLGFANLHDKFQRHKRPQKSGVLNGNNVNFETWEKNKQLTPLSIPMCCNDFWTKFNPLHKVKNQIGWSDVVSASFEEPSGELTLTLNS